MIDNPPLSVIEDWYSSLAYVKQNDGPAKGSIGGGLIVLERLKVEYDLRIEAHLTKKRGAQISGLSGKNVAKILNEFNEFRDFGTEVGRTNRGVQHEVKLLLQALEKLQLERLLDSERIAVLSTFQGFLVDRVRDYFNRQKLKLPFDYRWSTWQIIHELLELSRAQGKIGFVLQHLVGAKLQLRFPKETIENFGASTADLPTKREGDFRMRDTIFHVTAIVPGEKLFKKCEKNIKEKLKIYILVPYKKLEGTRQTTEQALPGMVGIESVESFVSQNIEELGFFEDKRTKDSLINLITLYNQRVDEVETDKSLLIELPANLKR